MESTIMSSQMLSSSRLRSLIPFWVLVVVVFSQAEGLSQNDLTTKTSRRSFVSSIGKVGGAIITGIPFITTSTESAFAEDDKTSTPFCVIGANGRTGTKCVKLLLEQNFAVRATSRTGVYYAAEDDDSSSNPLLQQVVCDVTDPTTIENAVQGTRAVIFAASASKAGGTPAQVDNEGLVAVAKACIAAKVPHLVIVSSGSVSKPNSPVYKFLNLFGGIMEQKILGEDAVRSLYTNQPIAADSSTPTYTIIRPGGLTEEPPVGASQLELNQGDLKSGRISRFDVASLCIESTFFPALTGGTTFECYEADTGKSLASVGVSNILKQTNEVSEFFTGKERRGATWKALFTGLERD